MNATTLYTQLSREVFFLNEDTDNKELSDFMQNDKGFFKLRSLLLCRSCRELCLEPYSSEFCQHLTCKRCLFSKQTRNSGCKWCRVDENLSFDVNSQILVGLYKNLCAILLQYLSEGTDLTGLPTEKDKLIKFLQEGCVSPLSNVVNSGTVNGNSETIVELTVKTGPNPQTNAINVMCPPCCCRCDKSKNSITSKKDISNDPIKVTAAESSCHNLGKSMAWDGEDLSDNVSSTVPDNVPVRKHFVPVPKNQNKHGEIQDGRSKSTTLLEKKQNLAEGTASYVKEQLVSPRRDKFYNTISSLNEQKKNIFEKFGLALTPPGLQTDSSDNCYDKAYKETKELPSKKLKKQKAKDNSSSNFLSESKLKPLKLKVKKVTNEDSTSSYKVQCSELPDEIHKDTNTNDKEIHIAGSRNEKLAFDDVLVSDSTNEFDSQITERKVKRKATFISNYAIFSDDSDFEQTFFDKSLKKPSKKRKKERDICGCGAGSNVKYFTDICKRSRCPCYSQGKACINCKCRFCSNPFLLDDEIEEETFTSDSSDDEPLINIAREEGLVDVEA